ncbi:2-succinyl-5-enolpyruvyl-6-hydroxy-3-cyclohexene-1-carboxylic-acid synthase [Maribacter sp. HTCC2170]|uniref:2-succinyl-5-enolpyruvyl-6-hydroxy-3- cyclohexene-1-carboxylic-acid synthase n=1 Tax=Maribacter sp. (strain HTCC2170 / KCCM 42371) TaxID=313603 RepID=UPI00006B21B8|nr:2-succinyl-5-enolpyruvyl-6-hydroxy-3-cyclohexene-1-carboxylic-acid synthase [Maribacter sp. HTCC2170]EAR00321.1 2-succinyl-6-hydroxy-2,4-cyclohexadiene-1-carboxylic acid synthase/2-oxoglutarate decarboxylase [Maribacter sp. HTCC2170]
MNYSSIPSAQTVIQHCKAKGIKDIIISPGSRNAPMTIGFTEDSFFNCFSIVDERCAAFFGLGMAQQLQKPVVVLCTSGSALLNYYPAVAEAFYSRIPLMVISADRPFYKIDVGDGQTIRQDYVFDRHIGYSANLKQDVSHATEKVKKYAPGSIQTTIDNEQEKIQEHNDNELNKAMNLAIHKQLPVHINVPFEEPLYNTHEKLTVTPNIEQKVQVNVPLVEIEGYAKQWNSAKRKMILVGVNHPNSVEQKYLDQLAADPSVIVLTETTSNLHHPNFFPSIDSIIAPIEKSKVKEKLFSDLQPDILLTFGGLVVSKKVKAFLRVHKPKHHWHVDEQRAYDTFFSLSHHFKSNVNTFFHRFCPLLSKVDSEYFGCWNKFKLAYEAKRAEYLSQIEYSDFKVFERIFEAIPENTQLQMANSSTIRYGQLFNLKPSIEVFCNRGTSGIDGSLSTAIGASLVQRKPTVLITGDLSFFYDSNGLWNKYIKADFRIILVNNDGGGIFRILPGQEETENFSTYFETIHELNAAHLCKMHNVEYSCVIEENSLKNELPKFFGASTIPKLLEIKTPRILNNKILIEYFDFISSGIINHIH